MKRIVTFVLVVGVALLAACGGGGKGGGGSEGGGGTPTPPASITAYSIVSPPAVGVIDQSTRSISLSVPYGTDLTSLVATFSAIGTGVHVGSQPQVSGSTANDFSAPVSYVVTAENGSTVTYTVHVNYQTRVYLESDSGDYIGGGRTYVYTKDTAQISATVSGGRFSVNVNGDEWWHGDFQLPNSASQLQEGTYNNLTRYSFHDPAVGGLDWWGEGRGCNTLTGWIVIDKVLYIGGTLKAVTLRFEQHCEGWSAALRGTIHWNADDTTTPPGPTDPVPSGLWQPADGTTPSSGNYVYLISDSGDYIGQGGTYLYTPSTSTIVLSATGGHLHVTVDGFSGWVGDFQAMSHLSQLQPGYYGSLQRYPFHNPVRGGLDWYGYGRGCNRLTGWFVVDSVTYVAGALTAVELRFEQHCEEGVPALRGKIRWAQ